MRYAHQLCALLLGVLMLLCACETNDTPATDDTDSSLSEGEASTPQAATFPIAPTDGAYAYTIIRNEDGSNTDRQALVDIRKALEAVYGTAPKPETNYTTEGMSEAELAARKEILVGRTGRPESGEVLSALGEGEYTIRIVGNKLVVLGKDDALTALAAAAFKTLIASAPTQLDSQQALLASYTPGSYQGEYNFAALGLQKQSDVRFEVVDGENDAEILYITSDDYNYTYGYFTNNSWVNPDILIAARDGNPNQRKWELTVIDTAREEVYLLPFHPKSGSEYVVHNELIYYVANEGLLVYNLCTGTTRTVLAMTGITSPHITSDGAYINVARHVDGLDTATVVNTATGEYFDIMAIRFEEPYPIANHHIICPTDHNILFFAHEGTTQYIPDRLWIAETGREPYNIAYQKTDLWGKPLDCFGHEHWAPDGQGLYFVKYACSPSSPKGVCYVSLEDFDEPQVLYSAHPYWHLACSPNGRYIASDTQEKDYSGVCLIDMETDEEILLFKAQIVDTAHPHPCFNTDSSKLIFHDYSKPKRRSLCIYELP